jgi:quercetin dioxygenase-like cupin family protein
MGHLILEIRHKKKTASNYERLKTVLFDYGDSVYIPPHVLHKATFTKAGILIDVFSPFRENFMV